MEKRPDLNPDIGPLDTSRNLSHDKYWETFSDLAGEKYTGHAHHNSRKLSALRSAMYGEQNYKKGKNTLTRAECAQEWYYSLGTHNSLKGANQDLWFAAQALMSSGDELLTPADMLVELQNQGGDQDTDANKLLAVQMLIDATKDPTGRDPVEDTALIVALKESTARIVKSYAHLAELSKGNITDEEKRILSDGLKFNFELRTMYIERTDDSVWEAKLLDLQRRALEDRNKRQGDRNSVPTKTEMVAQEYTTPEELKQYLLLWEGLSQVLEIRKLEKYLANGYLTEHYFIQLMRHVVLSKGASDVGVSSATARQDMPHDGIFNGSMLRKTSYDASVTGYRPNETLYVQLKAGMGNDTDYHEGVRVINPFGEKTNAEVRLEAIEGIAQLQGALGELVNFDPYAGNFQTLEEHVYRVKEGLENKVKVPT